MKRSVYGHDDTCGQPSCQRSAITLRGFWGRVVNAADLASTFLRSRSINSHCLMNLKVGQVGQVGLVG